MLDVKDGHKGLKHRPSLMNKGDKAWIFGQVMDPRSDWILRWNKVLLLTYALGAAVDPLFLYVVAIDSSMKCVYVEFWYAKVVTILRLLHNLVFSIHIYSQLRLAYVSKTSSKIGRGDLVFDARSIVRNYLHPRTGGFIYDIFIVLPLNEVHDSGS